MPINNLVLNKLGTQVFLLGTKLYTTIIKNYDAMMLTETWRRRTVLGGKASNTSEILIIATRHNKRSFS